MRDISKIHIDPSISKLYRKDQRVINKMDQYLDAIRVQINRDDVLVLGKMSASEKEIYFIVETYSAINALNNEVYMSDDHDSTENCKACFKSQQLEAVMNYLRNKIFAMKKWENIRDMIYFRAAEVPNENRTIN